MNVDFNQPQRQAPVGMFIIFLNTIRHLFRAFFPVLIALFVKPKAMTLFVFYFGGFGILIISAVIAYFKYRNFTFYLDKENEAFVITEGILNKTRTTIQLNKIQQVNISQSLIQKIIGVYALELDTAGSNKKEGNIKAVSHELAVALKARLMENESATFVSSGDDTVQVSVEKAEPFVKISLISLLKLGITSNYLKSFGLMMVYFFSVSEYIDQILGRQGVVINKIGSKVDEKLLIQSALILFVFFVFFIFALLMINLIRIIVKYFDYNIVKQHGNLLISYGLLNTQSTIIKPERVQIVSVSRNYFQKKMNILQIRIKQALSGRSEKNNGTIEIPGCSSHERDEILRLLFQQIPEKGLMLKPNFRKLGFSVFLSVILPLSIFLILAKEFIPELDEFMYLLPVYAVLVCLLQFFRFRNYRLFIKDDFIIRQSGAWDITNEIIEWSKIQHITTSQLFWHKPLNIGSLILHTAGGNISFDLGDFTKIKKYVNWWLYKLETSDSNWM